MWLFGAVLPTLGLALTIGVAGELFRLSLVRNLDEAMQAQASVDSVALFDGPSGEPHLVTGADIGDAQEHPSIVAVYDRNGDALIQFPHREHSPRTMVWNPGIRTTHDEHGHDVRELQVIAHSSNGRDYLLRLASPLASIGATVSTFYRTTISVGLIVALVLFLVQAWQAHALVRRIRVMTEYLPTLRDGVFAELPRDDAKDELAEQRSALAEAAIRVQRAREAQERLIANAAHELRSALTESRAEVDRLAYLASRLLDLAAVNRVARELREGDLVELINESVAAYSGQATFAVQTPAQASATFDRTAMRQALDNLLANACRHGSAPFHVALERVGATWALSVRDSGPGVATDQREKVFEPFSRGEQGGAGLGLAIVREVARSHGGDAHVEGARFTVTLPVEP